MLKHKVTIHEGCLCTIGKITCQSYFQKNDKYKPPPSPPQPSDTIRCIFYLQKKKKKTASTKNKKTTTICSAFVYRFVLFFILNQCQKISSPPVSCFGFDYLFRILLFLFFFSADLKEQFFSSSLFSPPTATNLSCNWGVTGSNPARAKVSINCHGCSLWICERHIKKHLQCKCQPTVSKNIYSKLSLWFLLLGLFFYVESMYLWP